MVPAVANSKQNTWGSTLANCTQKLRNLIARIKEIVMGCLAKIYSCLFGKIKAKPLPNGESDLNPIRENARARSLSVSSDGSLPYETFEQWGSHDDGDGEQKHAPVGNRYVPPVPVGIIPLD